MPLGTNVPEGYFLKTEAAMVSCLDYHLPQNSLVKELNELNCCKVIERP
jgi:hypothetical protein